MVLERENGKISEQFHQSNGVCRSDKQLGAPFAVHSLCACV
jgi:hypothetical protein